MKKLYERLWNKHFFLLWQGQLVSAIGEVVYEIALGFWVMMETGSTGLMGAIMAATFLPKFLLSPVSGVLIDRTDRKWLLIIMDVVRGVAVILVGVAAIMGLIRIWMVFVVGLLIGAGASFFNPAVNSILPDIVPREKLVSGNSFFAMIRAGSGVFGNSAGGILFGILGAPLLFLVNGITYVFSAFTELFITIPKVDHPHGKQHFLDDMKEGFRYVWDRKGLKFVLIAAGVFNFFAMMAFVLILPLFQRTPYLGPERFGFGMACLMGGMVAGMAVAATVKIKGEHRFSVIAVSIAVFTVFFAAFPLFESFYLMLVLVFIGGFFNAIVNVLLQTIMQLQIEQRMRGKVMGLLEMLTGGLTPVSMAVGGVLGEFLPIKWVISAAFVVSGLIVLPQLWSNEIRDFMHFEATEKKLKKVRRRPRF